MNDGMRTAAETDEWRNWSMLSWAGPVRCRLRHVERMCSVVAEWESVGQACVLERCRRKTECSIPAV